MLKNRLSPIAILTVLIPCLVYAIHALQLGTWVVDDAGITFAYAKNFAGGYGLVSQPGMSPVEGYSNFAWLLLLTPFFWLNIFDPAITPKIISFVLVAGTFTVIYQVLKPFSQRRWITLAALTLTALNTPFVVWTISGLENALYVFLVSLMIWYTVRIAFEGETEVRKAVWLGLLAAMTAMTRPDGLAYILAFPAILIPARQITWQRKGLLIIACVTTFGAIYGVFILFRLAYFGAPLPNTYYMKGGPEFKDVINLLTLQTPMLEKAQRLLKSAVGGFGYLLPLYLAGGSLYLIFTRKWTGRAWAILVYTLCSLSLYLLLPPDWMTEYRFATIFFMMLYLFSALIIATALEKLTARVVTPVLAALTLAAIVGSIGLFSPRTQAFSRNPTVPFQGVKEGFSDKLDWYKQALGLETASVMLPDVGGVLYYSDVLVYDLAGLTDRMVARYLGKTIYRPGFYEYVFETVRPTFIHTHGFWTQLTRLEDDPRFMQLYAPICAYTDPWVEQNYKIKRLSGDFVLREIAEKQAETVTLMREQLNNECYLK
jgi:hypothetical protein